MIERIQFANPQLKDLKREGFFCADMHFHSKYSDTFTRPRSIMKLAAKKGISFALTDHNQIQGCIELNKEKKRYGVDVINGIEISTKEGPHVLAYFYSIGDMKEFYEKNIKNNKNKNPYMALKIPTEDLMENIKEYNCILSAAHPRSVSVWDLQRKVDKGEICSSVLDTVQHAEVICGLILRKMNLRAARWAFENNMGITGGSDGHTLQKLGSVVAYSKAHDVDSFLDSIRKKNNFVVGTETKILPRMFSYSKAITKHSRYVGPSIMIHRKLGLKDSFRNWKDKVINRKKNK